MLSLERPHRSAGQALFRIGGVLLGITLLGACQTSTARRTTPRFETAFSALNSAGSRPLVSLPNSGPVASVTETPSSAGLRQRIVFGPPGGRIDLTMASGRVWDDPAMAKPSRAGIAAELATLDGGGSYRIVRRPVHNAYGPLGVAVSERCAYAWQWIDGLDRVELGRGALRGPVSVSLRVQHCHRRPTGAEALLADLVRMRLGPASDPATAVRRRRIASPKPKQAKSVERAAPAVPASPQPAAPPVAVNGSRTLVILPQGPAAPQYLAQPAPAAAGPALPTVPRPIAAGSATDRLRFLTDAVPASSPTAKVSSRAPQAAPTEPSARFPAGSRPPQGW
ncbi:hypothetical protein ASF53_20895 [Methylobacterium sp. Leaf123]|nr:hypothetical protein ASF53_20895 [Methylobacterium sp. Leaf123]